MADTNTLAARFNANTTFGAFSIGVEFSILLLGVLTLQSYNYFSHFPKDPLWIKAVVVIIWCMEMAQATCITGANYVWLINNYGDPLVLIEKAPLILSTAMIFGVLISPISQSFFAWRLFKLSRRRLISTICWSVSLIRLAATLLCWVEVMKMNTIPQVLTKWKWLFIFIFAFGWSVDALTAFCLCYYINRERPYVLHRTAQIMGKIMEYIIQTNLITSIIEFAMMATFLTMPQNFIWLFFFNVLPRLFSNSLLASLNARAHLHEQLNIHTILDLSIGPAAMNPDYGITTQDLESGTQ